MNIRFHDDIGVQPQIFLKSINIPQAMKIPLLLIDNDTYMYPDRKNTHSEDIYFLPYVLPIGPFLSLIIKMEGTPYFDSYENITRLTALVFQSYNS